MVKPPQITTEEAATPNIVMINFIIAGFRPALAAAGVCCGICDEAAAGTCCAISSTHSPVFADKINIPSRTNAPSMRLFFFNRFFLCRSFTPSCFFRSSSVRSSCSFRLFFFFLLCRRL